MRSWLPVLALIAGAWLFIDAGFTQTQPNRPSKIAVRVPPRVFGVGDEANLHIALMDASNETAKATKELEVTVDCVFPSGSSTSWKVRFKPGESSQRLRVPLLEMGVMEIIARNRELLDGGNLLNVMAERQPRRRDGTGGATPPQNWQPRLRLYSVPRRKIWADEKDSATIFAHLGPNDTARWDMYVSLLCSTGRMTPDPLIIKEGESVGHATLVSDRPLPSTVEFVSSNPWAELINGQRLEISFAPALTHFSIKASPPIISLFEQTELVVELLDERGRKTETDEARSIFLTLAAGSGELKNTEIVIIPGRYEGRATFFPTSHGQVRVSASSASLPEEHIDLQVIYPLLLLSLSAVGGFLGGLLAYWTKRPRKRWRLIVGVITGFVFYWGFLFGVLPLVPNFPRAFVLNPFSAIVFPVLGGWLGTEIFSPILKWLGVPRNSQ